MKKLIYVLMFLTFAGLANAQWQPDVRLTNASGSSYTSLNNTKCIATNGNVVHTVWYDNREGNWEIYYKRSTDGGTIWQADTRLTYNTAYSESPSVAVSGLNIHVVWKDSRNDNFFEIYYKRSTDGGTTWGPDTRLTNNNAWSDFPSIAVSGSLVHVVWEDICDGNWEIYYKRSTDGGINWGADTRLTNNNAGSYIPSITVSGKLINVVWYDWRDDNNEIYYKRSTDGGTNWGADTRLTNNTDDSHSPSIAVSDTPINVVWCDWRDGNAEIYYKRSADGGTTWEADIRLTNNTEWSRYPSIAVSGLLVHVIWEDWRDGKSEIYYKRSADGGASWEADTRLTNNNDYSSLPSIAVSGLLVHVVWIDLRDGNHEIYYKRNPTGNVGIKNISTEVSSEFSLEQNYPNPFNPTTNIKFAIPRASSVKISVFDATGREVKVLVNEQLQPGTYQADWNASAYSSGVYFYKLSAGDFLETKRMILLK
ncbi:MAG: exo-alpha-sialidase [Ignavibacteria bacterium]